MANPQVEEGRSEIANELMDAIIKTHFTPRESAVFWTVVRKTYGWHKKTDRISYSQFETATGMSQRHIGPTLRRLIDRQIISRFGEGHSLEYAVQKNYELWQTLPILVVANTTENGSEDTTDIGSDTLPKMVALDETQTLPKTVSNTTESCIKTLPKSVDTKALTKALDKSNIIYIGVFEFWNSQGVYHHKKLLPEIESAIKTALTKYTEPEIIDAIKTYGHIIAHPELFYWTHRWTLKDFLKRGLEKFSDCEIAKQNYKLKDGGNGNGRIITANQVPAGKGISRTFDNDPATFGGSKDYFPGRD